MQNILGMIRIKKNAKVEKVDCLELSMDCGNNLSKPIYPHKSSYWKHLFEIVSDVNDVHNSITD